MARKFLCNAHNRPRCEACRKRARMSPEQKKAHDIKLIKAARARRSKRIAILKAFELQEGKLERALKLLEEAVHEAADMVEANGHLPEEWFVEARTLLSTKMKEEELVQKVKTEIEKVGKADD